jgi:hypothetical protein
MPWLIYNDGKRRGKEKMGGEEGFVTPSLSLCYALFLRFDYE